MTRCSDDRIVSRKVERFSALDWTGFPLVGLSDARDALLEAPYDADHHHAGAVEGTHLADAHILALELA